jgi:hypothetical protein
MGRFARCGPALFSFECSVTQRVCAGAVSDVGTSRVASGIVSMAARVVPRSTSWTADAELRVPRVARALRRTTAAGSAPASAVRGGTAADAANAWRAAGAVDRALRAAAAVRAVVANVVRPEAGAVARRADGGDASGDCGSAKKHAHDAAQRVPPGSGRSQRARQIIE